MYCFCTWSIAADLLLTLSSTVFHLPEAQVTVLHPIDKLRVGDVVYAVYPDTTSFYQATIVARKPNFCLVSFLDDSDEFGVTHDKAVPLKHLMLPPYGATVQG